MPKAPGTVDIQPIGWDELAAKLKDKELVHAALNAGLKRAGKEILVPAVKDASPVGATKNLRNKTVGQVLGTYEDMRLEVRQSAFNKNYPYGVGVRLGTRPHWPPYKALIPWVKAILNAPQPERVAFLIARKISKVGTKANPYHEKVAQQKSGDVRRVMLEQMQKVFDEKFR